MIGKFCHYTIYHYLDSDILTMNHSPMHNNVLEYGNEATDCLLSTHSILELMNVKAEGTIPASEISPLHQD